VKLTVVDKIVEFFSPDAAVRRIKSRMALEGAKRGYDAAKAYTTSDWTSASKSGVNAEVSAGQPKLIEKSRDLARNSPYAVRALNVIVSNVVGSGIMANIKGKRSQVKKLMPLWKKVTETSLCDSEGRNNFYGLQALAIRSIAESGEIIGLKEITPEAPKIKLLESDFIVSKEDGGRKVQGIEFDNKGRRTKYYLYKQHPGEKGSSEDMYAVPADKVAHPYRQDRPGQVRGVPWSHAVIETLKDMADYQNATIIGKKVAACFVGVITTSGTDSALSSADLQARRESEMLMQPGTMRYADQGESVQFSNPPVAGGYAEFIRESMRAIAAGYGISYEALTGDYSQVNFSSGRMGNHEFRRNIENWRWNILIPLFCEPYSKWFLEWASMQGIDTTDVVFEWDPPAHVMIDPIKEIEALKREVRSGFKSYGQAVREQGLDPDTLLEEAAEWNKKFDDLKLSFDSDPRRLSNVGSAHPKDTLPLLSEAEMLEPEEGEDTVTNEYSEEEVT